MHGLLWGNGLYAAQRPNTVINTFPELIMAKVFTIPVPPNPARRKREGSSDARYLAGQRLIVQAIQYLTKSNPDANRPAIELLSEHFRTRFRMSDHPGSVQ